MTLTARAALLAGASLAAGALSLDAQAPARSSAPPRVVRQAPAAPGSFDPSALALRYRMVGPARGGRVTAVTGVVQEPHTFYFGSTGGGVWRTTDAGHSWQPLSDGQIAVGSIGALDVADSDPNVIYVGTGSEGLRSNVSIGNGVYKSSDAGKTWKHIGLPKAGAIGAVVIHPTNPNTVFVAAVGNPFAPNPERGVYRTTDGGATWTQVLRVSDSTGAVDVEMKPDDPNTLYATMWRAERKPWTIISGGTEGGVYKSTDGGTTWTKLTNGLPNGLFGKSDLAVSAANPNRVYALIEAKPGNGLYRSDDAGATWAQVSSMPGLITRPFYYTNVDADPTNADRVFVGTEGFYVSTDGGRTFRTMRTPHGDNHEVWVHPRNPAIWIQANDGGVNVTLNDGRTWSTQYNQPTAEIYQVYVDDQWPYRLYGAQQDNSTLIVPSLPTGSASPDDPIQSWRAGPGCETGPIMPHPLNPDTVYGSCKGQYSRMSLRTGQEKQYWVGAQSLYANPGKDLIFRFQRVSPMEVSRHFRNTIYYGSQYVHRTRDEGVTWEVISPDLTANEPQYQQKVSGEPITIDVTGEEYYSTLYAIRESPLDGNVIWTGANDGPIHVTRDAGKTWTKVTPPTLPGGGRVQTVEPSPHRVGGAYVAVLRYLLGDFKPYVYKTDDFGKTWTLLTPGNNGVGMDAPTRVIREDPERPGLLYLGTEYGMHVSFDDGKRWHSLQLNLPATPITDMKVHRGDLVLSTQGRAFWILDNLAPLRQLTDAAAAKPVHLFAPRTAYRMRYRGSFGGVESGRPGGAETPQYLPAGAVIDYWLGSAPSQPVTMDIVDASGTVIRSFTSAGAGERSVPPAEPGMRAPVLVVEGTPRLPAQAGHNRFVWDLTMPGPWSPNAAQRGRNGPTIAPGRYTVRISAGGRTESQPLVVELDPRVVKDGITPAIVRDQLAFNLRVRDLVSEGAQLVDRVRRARASATDAQQQARLDAMLLTLAGSTVRYGQPGLQTHINYLYGMSDDADQAISKDARDRYTTLRRELDVRTREVNALLGAAR